MKCFPQFWYGKSTSINFLGNVEWKLAKQMGNIVFSIIP